VGRLTLWGKTIMQVRVPKIAGELNISRTEAYLIKEAVSFPSKTLSNNQNLPRQNWLPWTQVAYTESVALIFER
jgi:hypothetical protein